VRTLMVWDQESSIGKAKAMYTSKVKEGINSLLPTGRQVFSHLQQSRAPSHATVTWEDKCHHSEHPCLRSFPSFLFLNMMSYVMEYPSVQMMSAVPAVSPPNFLCIPSLLTDGVV